MEAPQKSSRLRRARQYTMYLAYRAGARLVRLLPGPLVDPLAIALGWTAAKMLPGRRRVVAATMRRVTGHDLQGRARTRRVDAVFIAYARYWFETFRLPDITPDELDRRMSYEGLEHLERERDAGRGIVLVAPHLGGWDFGGAWIAAQGYRLTTVVEGLKPDALFDWFAALREGLGIQVLRHGPDSLAKLREALADGRTVVLVSDRDLGRRGVEVELFGEPTSLPAGPARLALETGASLLTAALYVGPDGQHRAVVRPPLQKIVTGDMRDDVATLTGLLARELEVLIAAEPTQWHVMQSLWPADTAQPAGT